MIDWDRFFDLPGFAQDPQPSFRIDTGIGEPLFCLPDGGEPLPQRNLTRGSRLGLPSGQDVACAMGEQELPDKALLLDKQVEPKARDALIKATPALVLPPSARRRTPRAGSTSDRSAAGSSPKCS